MRWNLFTWPMLTNVLIEKVQRCCRLWSLPWGRTPCHGGWRDWDTCSNTWISWWETFAFQQKTEAWNMLTLLILLTDKVADNNRPWWVPSIWKVCPNCLECGVINFHSRRGVSKEGLTSISTAGCVSRGWIMIAGLTWIICWTWIAPIAWIIAAGLFFSRYHHIKSTLTPPIPGLTHIKCRWHYLQQHHQKLIEVDIQLLQ